jgi:predicted RNA-binding Zn ribbon-like protein
VSAPFELVGGRLCLDFVNTVSAWPRGPDTREDLPDYARLLAWAQATGALTRHGAAALRARAEAHPDQARRTHRDALALRAALYRVFRAVIDGSTPTADDVGRVDAAVADAHAARRLAWRDGRFAQEWPADAAGKLDSLLWPVALSAQQVLCDDDPARLRVCASSANCGWLFYDTSKNGARRWCSMETCGNSAKARRHHARRKRAHRDERPRA